MISLRSRPICSLVGIVLLATSLQARGLAQAATSNNSTPLVYAAASLTDVLQQIATDYARDQQQTVKFSFGSSATLARQIEAGAPADLFISADQDWMDYLAGRKLIDVASRRDLLGNALVLIAPATSKVGIDLQRNRSVETALGADGRLALADPASVPAGKYAKAALNHLGLWDRLQARIVSADNVRAALMFVARGEAPLGIVYETDARAEPRVRTVARFPASSHAPIIYPVALTARAAPAARSFAEYLRTSAARARFEAAGFKVLPADRKDVTDCRIGDWAMTSEQRLFQSRPRPMAAGTEPSDRLPSASLEGLWEMSLSPQPAVRFVAPPSRQRASAADFAGLARVTVPVNGRYRITIDGPAWIDLLIDGKPLVATKFGSQRSCALFRKSVEFELAAGAEPVLQISYAKNAKLRLTIQPSPGTDEPRTPSQSH